VRRRSTANQGVFVASYPLVTLSTRAQVESTRAHSTLLAAVRHIVQREGVSGLYAGLDTAVFGISVTNFVYYYFYEWVRSFFAAAALRAGRASRRLTTLESIVAGAIAGSATVVMTNPIWVVNTRMTTRRQTLDEQQGAGEPGAAKKRPPTTVGTLLALLRSEGPQALLKGVMPALVLVVNPIVQYTLFEQMKNAVAERRRVTPAIAFLLGALGKAVATSVTYPYITLKSQMHVAGNGHKESMGEAMRRLVREEGWKGLYKGELPLRDLRPCLRCAAQCLYSRSCHAD
jgi:solute carrier family 25 (peroxisomal adenine nucleotide transporter), member 17